MRVPLLFGVLAGLVLGISSMEKSAYGKPAVASPQKKSALKEPKDFDRLDGKGPSRKRVDVIEWENNLEIHVYPKGSLKSLGLKVDRTNKNRPVMVVEYAFNGIPYSVVRRALLSIKLSDQFLTFKDPSAEDYDKIMISNNTLDSVIPFKAIHEPRQMYPDVPDEEEGPPALATNDEPAQTIDAREEKIVDPGTGNVGYGTNGPQNKIPGEKKVPQYSDQKPENYNGINPNARNAPGVKMKTKERVPANVDEDGNIRSFEF